jgi:ATP-dependent DNA helicase RecG
VIDITETVENLRRTGGDTAAVEAKSAAGGLPESLQSSLSALANLPGGGLIILGLDENTNFSPVELNDPNVLKQGLGNLTRSLTPPVHLEIEDADVDGISVITARVAECPPSQKPCRASNGKAYLRSYDGDYPLSELEEQAFLHSRTASHADRMSVPDTTVEDLENDLVSAWTDQVKARNPQGLGRFAGVELLRRGGVVAADGSLTKAGLLVLGTYPQQFFPQFVLRVADRRGLSRSERARNVQSIDGPIPRILSATLEWLRSNLANTAVANKSGALVSQQEFPLEALRELVANALVHRDLEAWSEGMAIELRLETGKLVLSNPGGLYGITVDRLTKEHVTSARNPRLVQLCENATDSTNNSRVIEALASGLPRVAELLEENELSPAQFWDNGINFTVKLTSGKHLGTTEGGEVPSVDRRTPSSLRRGTQLEKIYLALLDNNQSTTSELATITGISAPSVRRALTRLRNDYHLVEAAGGPGQSVSYRITDSQTK